MTVGQSIVRLIAGDRPLLAEGAISALDRCARFVRPIRPATVGRTFPAEVRFACRSLRGGGGRFLSWDGVTAVWAPASRPPFARPYVQAVLSPLTTKTGRRAWSMICQVTFPNNHPLNRPVAPDAPMTMRS